MTRYQLTTDSIPLLLKLSDPVEREEVISRVASESGLPRARLEELFDSLLQVGILNAETTATAQPSGYSFAFGKLVNHRAMLADTARTGGFRRAIQEVVGEGDVVIDVGAGSGILSFFAAQAGAARVFALETSRVIHDARRLAEDNGLADRVEFVECDAGAFVTPRQADVIVSEFVGTFLVDEWRHFQAFAKVRDTCLRPGGTVIPRRAHLFLAPIDDSRLHQEVGLGFWDRSVHGLDFRLGRARQIESHEMKTCQVFSPSILGEPWKVLDLDFLSDDSSAYLFESVGETRLSTPATCHGYVGYFNLDLTPDVRLDTSPFSVLTHWKQAYFPVEAFAIEAGDTLVTQVGTRRDEVTGSPSLDLHLALERGERRVHEARYTFDVGDRPIG